MLKSDFFIVSLGMDVIRGMIFLGHFEILISVRHNRRDHFIS